MAVMGAYGGRDAKSRIAYPMRGIVEHPRYVLALQPHGHFEAAQTGDRRIEVEQLYERMA